MDFIIGVIGGLLVKSLTQGTQNGGAKRTRSGRKYGRSSKKQNIACGNFDDTVAKPSDLCDGRKGVISQTVIEDGKGVCLTGNCYDKSNLLKWYDRNPTNPITRQAFTLSPALLDPEVASQSLIVAAQEGRLEDVQKLLAVSGINVNLQDEDGNTALIEASAEGHTEIVKLLLDVPYIDVPYIDVNLQDKWGTTALIRASINGYTEIVKLLLDVPYIDVNLQDENGKTALIWASSRGHTEIVKLLLAVKLKDINVNLQDKRGKSALIWASYRGHTNIVKLLLDVPYIDVNLQRGDGDTALIWASINGYTEIVKLLLNMENIVVNVKNNYGITALIYASKEGHIEIVKLLLAVSGINVNLQRGDGDTALIWASINGHTEIVKLLLAVPGIDVNLQNENGDTALSIASEKGHTDIIKLIKNHQLKRRVRGIARTIPKTKQAQVRAGERVYVPDGPEYKKLQDEYYREPEKQIDESTEYEFDLGNKYDYEKILQKGGTDDIKKYQLQLTFFNSTGVSIPQELHDSIIRDLYKQVLVSDIVSDISVEEFTKEVQKEDGQCGMFVIMFIENMLYDDKISLSLFTDERMKMLRSIIFSDSAMLLPQSKTNISQCSPEDMSARVYQTLRNIRKKSNTLEEYKKQLQKKLPELNVSCTSKPKNEYPHDDTAWLSNIDIDNVFEQYEKIEELKFKYINAVGIDAGKPNCYSSELCSLHIDELIESGKRKFAVVYNTDKHHSSGEHWIALFGKLEEI